MSNKVLIASIVSFTLGAVAGAFGGYYFGKNKFQELADKEIASVKKVYEKHFPKNTPEATPAPVNNDSVPSSEQLVDKEKEAYKNYAGIYGKEGVVPPTLGAHTTIETPKPTPRKKSEVKRPYVISPEEFRDSDYEAETLIWYADKILADSDGNVIKDVNGLIGPEALSTFGRYEEDAVYVRDDSKKIDYEILWDGRKYSVAHNQKDDPSLPSED